MMISAKVMSSPGRPEKFPPPLMRFLRSNIASKSRRSRASPLFFRKKNTAPNNNDTTQEPSSPKVTCIGQVRARRSSKKSGLNPNNPKTPPPPPKPPCSCCWVRKTTLCCPHFRRRLKPRSFRCVWGKWCCFSPCGCSRRREISSKPELNEESNHKVHEDGDDDDDEKEEEEAKVVPVEAYDSSAPPKNAFALTKCRSAPYRSSSSINRFCGSLLDQQETEEDGSEESSVSLQHRRSSGKETEGECEPNSRFSDSESTLEGGDSRDYEARTGEKSIAEPLIVLVRCKSEPARTGERLNPEVTMST